MLLPKVEIFRPGMNTTRTIISYLNLTPRKGVKEREEAIRVLSKMSYYSSARVGTDQYTEHLKMSR